jgi:hypothetical protein
VTALVTAATATAAAAARPGQQRPMAAIKVLIVMKVLLRLGAQGAVLYARVMVSDIRPPAASAAVTRSVT